MLSGAPPTRSVHEVGSDSLLYIFARAPEVGRVKTRLIPAVGAEAAARLHLAFIDDVCALSRGLAGRRVLSVAGDPDHPSLVALSEREQVARVAQDPGDLGARMATAIADGLALGARRVAIIGSDSPMLPPAYIAAAFEALDQRPIVIGPAEDGGYWLVGARLPVPWLFEGIRWSTASVFAETRTLLEARHSGYALAPSFWDVDEPADLARLRLLLATRPGVAPASRALLAALPDTARADNR